MSFPSSAQAATWFQAANDRTLLVQSCSDCGNAQHYPRSICTACGGEALSFSESAGSGKVISWSVVERSPDPNRFTAPYTIAIIELAEGVRLLSRLIADDPQCDADVTLDWDTFGDDQVLPVFVQEATD